MAVMEIFFRFPGVPRVQCVFTGRERKGEPAGSVSPPDSVGRRRLLEILEQRGVIEVRECRQVHGTNIMNADGPGGNTTEADGLMTDKAGVALLIKTADCQPLLVADQAGRHVMALHVGWRGNRAHFPAVGVKEFCRAYSLAPEELLAVRGPSLGQAEFDNFSKDWGNEFAPWYSSGTGQMDLWALTRQQLMDAGLRPDRIYGMDICTLTNADRFFSYRGGDAEARQGSAIWISADAVSH